MDSDEFPAASAVLLRVKYGVSVRGSAFTASRYDTCVATALRSHRHYRDYDVMLIAAHTGK